MRILRPSLVLVSLAVALVLLGGVLTAPARAAGAGTPAAVTAAAAHIGAAGDPVVKAGEDVLVPAGTTTQTVVAAGGDITVDGSVTDAVVAFGGDIVVNGSVGSSVVAFGGDVTVDGPVGASVVAFGGDVKLLPGAVVGTSMKPADKTVVLFGGELTRDPSAQVTGETVTYDNANWTAAASWFGDGMGRGIVRPWGGFTLLGWIVQAAICLVLGLVAAALLPKQMRAVQRKLAEKTAASLGWGALAFFVIAPAVLVVLVISVVGLLLVVPYAVFLALFYFFVITAVGALVAGLLLRGTQRRDSLMLAVVIGVLATTVISKVPVAGFLTLLVMAVFGTGAAVLAYGEYRRARRAVPAPAPAGGPAGPAPAPAGAEYMTATAVAPQPPAYPTATAVAAQSPAYPTAAPSAAETTAATVLPAGAAYVPATPPVPPEAPAAPGVPGAPTAPAPPEPGAAVDSAAVPPDGPGRQDRPATSDDTVVTSAASPGVDAEPEQPAPAEQPAVPADPTPADPAPAAEVPAAPAGEAPPAPAGEGESREGV
jgi:hypothetical protein